MFFILIMDVLRFGVFSFVLVYDVIYLFNTIIYGFADAVDCFCECACYRWSEGTDLCMEL